MKGTKQGGFVPPMARPGNTSGGKPSPANAKGSAPSQRVGSGTQDGGGGYVPQPDPGVSGTSGKGVTNKVATSRKNFTTGTDKGQGGSQKPSGVGQRKNNSGGFVPPFGG